MRRTAFLLAVIVLFHVHAWAQTDTNRPDPTKVKMKFGPLIVNPTITLGNVGSDDNVFNEASNPRRDVTMTLSPKAELWLPFLGSWFEGIITEDLNWYQQYSSERSANQSFSLNWKLPLPRVSADLGIGRAATRARP